MSVGCCCWWLLHPDTSDQGKSLLAFCLSAVPRAQPAVLTVSFRVSSVSRAVAALRGPRARRLDALRFHDSCDAAIREPSEAVKLKQDAVRVSTTGRVNPCSPDIRRDAIQLR